MRRSSTGKGVVFSECFQRSAELVEDVQYYCPANGNRVAGKVLDC
jgi:hypothetical protein